jgi:hypothetical protein
VPKTPERIISEAAHVPSSLQRSLVPPMFIEHMFMLAATAGSCSQSQMRNKLFVFFLHHYSQ